MNHSLLASYKRIRAATELLCEPLAVEDYGLQSMVEASPVKWHLAHTTWLFETFVLKPRWPAYEPIEDPNLMGWWAFDETVGKTAGDTSVNGRDAQISGIPVWTQGVHGNALQLRNPAYMEIPSGDRTLSGATIAMWIRPAGPQPDFAAILAEGSMSLSLMSDSRLAYHWSSAPTTSVPIRSSP